jgi:hypothetical protein
LKRRLRMQVYDDDSCCPCCGLVLDKWGDHALVCQCGGDRTVRHNAILNNTYQEAAVGGVRPEREKAGLLPGRPPSDDDPSPGDSRGRRPADIWLPRGPSGGKEALDFAVTSGLRAGLIRQSGCLPEAVFQKYEAYKREYKQTAQACTAAGFRFVPLVFEAHSGGGAKPFVNCWTGFPGSRRQLTTRSPSR